MIESVVWKNERWGWMALALEEGTVVGLVLPRPSRTEAVRRLKELFPEAVTSKDPSPARAVDAFLDGKSQALPLSIKMKAGTPFQRKIWRAACSIPYGQTRTYGWLAKRAGSPRAVRAAGSAMGANRLPLFVPCHRVVSATGLGGFSSGTALKEKLLQLERGEGRKRT